MVNFFNHIKNKFNKQILKDKFAKYNFLLKPFICIFIIFAIAISGILRADFNYVDDLGRIAEGYKKWDNFSRYVSCFLSSFIHTSEYLTDISPLPQLLAVCIMAISAVIMLFVYKGEKKFSFWDILAIIPLGLSPYFLECLSYKYDAPYMAISIFTSIFPLLFRKRNKILYSFIIIINTLIMCMTYQASSGIFLMFILLIFLKDWNNNEDSKENFKFLLISSTSFFARIINI